MDRLSGKQTLLRIFLSEHDTYQHKPAYLQILEMLRKEKIAGATVLRGVAGFGAQSRQHHAGIIDISNNLPLVIEAVDTEEAIKAVVLKLEPMVGDGLVTLEEITVVGFKSKS